MDTKWEVSEEDEQKIIKKLSEKHTLQITHTRKGLVIKVYYYTNEENKIYFIKKLDNALLGL